MSRNSDAKKLLRKWQRVAEKAGWTVEQTGGNHLCWTSPTGESTYTPLTPGARRSLQNTRAQLRRAGLDI